MSIVEKTSPIPRYFQVSMDIKEKIASGELSSGTQLPTEQELCEAYNVSRITIRQALDEMQKEGIIEKLRGKGSFIKSNPGVFVHKLHYPLSITTTLNNLQIPFERQAVRRDLYTGKDITIQNKLEISADAPVVEFFRLYRTNGIPFVFLKSWIPQELVPGILQKEMVNGSLYNTLAEYYDLRPARVKDIFSVIKPDQELIDILQIQHYSSVILLEGIARTSNGKPLEYTKSFWIPEKVNFQFDLENRADGLTVLKY